MLPCCLKGDEQESGYSRYLKGLREEKKVYLIVYIVIQCVVVFKLHNTGQLFMPRVPEEVALHAKFILIFCPDSSASGVLGHVGRALLRGPEGQEGVRTGGQDVQQGHQVRVRTLYHI